MSDVDDVERLQSLDDGELAEELGISPANREAMYGAKMVLQYLSSEELIDDE